MNTRIDWCRVCHRTGGDGKKSATGRIHIRVCEDCLSILIIVLCCIVLCCVVFGVYKKVISISNLLR
jgi:hypothetical protein